MLTDVTHDIALTAIAAAIDRISLHSAYSNTGANELTGGSPAYARLTPTWGTAASGSIALSADATFDVPAGSTVAFLGFWLNAGSVFRGMTPLAPVGSQAPQVFAGADITTEFLTCPGHGFSDTQQVVLFGIANEALPAGLTEGTIYFVRDATTDTFKVAATSGGTAINITGTGVGIAYRVVPEVVAGQGQHVVKTGTAITL